MKRQEIIDLKIDDLNIFQETNEEKIGVKGLIYKGDIVYYRDEDQFLIIEDAYQGRCTNIDFFIEICKNVIECGLFQVDYKGKCIKCKEGFDIESLLYDDYQIPEYPQDLEDNDCFCYTCYHE